MRSHVELAQWLATASVLGCSSPIVAQSPSSARRRSASAPKSTKFRSEELRRAVSYASYSSMGCAGPCEPRINGYLPRHGVPCARARWPSWSQRCACRGRRRQKRPSSANMPAQSKAQARVAARLGSARHDHHDHDGRRNRTGMHSVVSASIAQLMPQHPLQLVAGRKRRPRGIRNRHRTLTTSVRSASASACLPARESACACKFAASSLS